MRYLILFASTLLVGGCALPISVQVATWAASGFSYVTTGKGISHHAVSAIAEQDCAMHRIAFGEAMCNEAQGDGTVVVENGPPNTATGPGTNVPTKPLRDSIIALATNPKDSLLPASDISKTPPLNNALLAIAHTLSKIENDQGSAMVADNQGNKSYLVIGHYQVFEEAEKIRARHTALGAKIRMILQEGALLYRVTAGPFNQPDAQDIKAKIGELALSTHIALLCSNRPCNDNDRQLTALPANGVN